MSPLLYPGRTISSAVHRRRRTGRPSNVEASFAAWFAGDFETCLEQCDAVTARDRDTVIQIELIRTRALLRLNRTDEALNTLEKLLSALPEGDARRTAEMLLGSAHIRRGEIGRGLEILAAADAKAATAHATIRSEIALNRALGFFGRRNLNAAEGALVAVDPNSDIVFARALEYRGWIASARTDYDLAAEFFLSALH